MPVSQLEVTPLLTLLYAMSIYGAMLLLGWALLKFDWVRSALTTAPSRYGCLDGLRGVLALGVLTCHSFTAYVYFSQGHWGWSASPILNQLGQTGVALFFMITGFLFTLKASAAKVNWSALYLSRILRLGPLYWLVLLVVFAVVLLLSKGVVKETPWLLLKAFALWASFVVFGQPDINAYPLSWTLVAGVNWSLKYEVLFYVFAVPVLHVLYRIGSVRTSLVVTLVLFVLLLWRRYTQQAGPTPSLFVAHFLGGIVVANVYQVAALRPLLGALPTKLLALAGAVSLAFMPHSFSVWAVLCATVIFAAVVGGVSLFGLLKTKAAIWLGDISYGVYLLHGLTLWLTLSALKSWVNLASLGLMLYWPIVIAVAAAVVLLASLSYAKLERPLMLRLADRVKAPGGIGKTLIA